MHAELIRAVNDTFSRRDVQQYAAHDVSGEPRDGDGKWTLEREKPKPKKPVFGGGPKATQPKLFGTEGLPGERNLFATPGVPDEDVYKPPMGSSDSRPTTYFKGDLAEYTGESTDDGFYVVELMEGHRKGQKVLTATSPTGTNQFDGRSMREWQEQQEGFRNLRNVAATSISPSKQLFSLAFSSALERLRYDKAGSFVESDHPRGQPANAGQFTKVHRDAMHSALARTGSASHGGVNIRITQHPAGKHRGHAVEWTEGGATTVHAPKIGLQFRDAVAYAVNKMWRTRGAKEQVAPVASPPKTDFGPGVKTLSDGRKVGMAIVTANDLAADPARFQYKITNIGEGGVTQELKEVKRFRPEFAGTLLVWHDPKDNRTYVVNGHHRFDLAKRAGYDGPLSVNLIDAKDDKAARALGALANIAEGRGSALDAGKFFRESGTKPADLAAEGVSLKAKIADDGLSLSKASDTIFKLLANKRMDESRALAIVRGLEDKPEVQDEVLRDVEGAEARGRAMPDNVIRELSREAAMSPVKNEEIRDLFGSYEQMRSLRVERAEIKSHLRKAFSKDATIFGEITKRGRAEKLGQAGNVINEEQNKARAQEASSLKWLYEKLANSKGELSDAINQAAEEYAGNPKGKRDIFAGIERTASEALRREWDRHAGAGVGTQEAIGSGEKEPDSGTEAYSRLRGSRRHEGYRPGIRRLVEPSHQALSREPCAMPHALTEHFNRAFAGHNPLFPKSPASATVDPTEAATLKFARNIAEQPERYGFNEADHPRGQPENAGEFGSKKQSATPKAAPAPAAPKAAAPAQAPPARRQITPDQMQAELTAHARSYPPANPKAVDSHGLHSTPEGAFTPHRQRLHESILGEAMRGSRPAQGQPTAFVMGGGPASGKSSIINSGAVTFPEGHVLVDPDKLKESIPEYDSMLAGNHPTAAPWAHEESSHLGKELTRRALAMKAHLVLDGTGDSSIESLAGKLSKMRAAGHRVVGHYVTVDPNVAVERANARAAQTGRHVPEEVIRHIHSSVSHVLPEAIRRGLFDEVHLWDTNGGGAPKHIASGAKNQLTVHDPVAYNRFLSYGAQHQPRSST